MPFEDSFQEKYLKNKLKRPFDKLCPICERPFLIHTNSELEQCYYIKELNVNV